MVLCCCLVQQQLWYNIMLSWFCQQLFSFLFCAFIEEFTVSRWNFTITPSFKLVKEFVPFFYTIFLLDFYTTKYAHFIRFLLYFVLCKKNTGKAVFTSFPVIRINFTFKRNNFSENPPYNPLQYHVNYIIPVEKCKPWACINLCFQHLPGGRCGAKA